jgi:hypothetical protein
MKIEVLVNIPGAIAGYASWNLPGRGADSMGRGLGGL